METKKLRNKQFCKGDLVSPLWNPKVPYGLGVIIDIDEDILNRGITQPCILIAWQNGVTGKEHPIDIQVVQQALD